MNIADGFKEFHVHGGWNFFPREDRLRVWRYIGYFKPVVNILYPKCKGFSTVVNANWAKMCTEDANYVLDTCYAMWLFSIQVAVHQATNDLFFTFEHPCSLFAVAAVF